MAMTPPLDIGKTVHFVGDKHIPCRCVPAIITRVVDETLEIVNLRLICNHPNNQWEQSRGDNHGTRFMYRVGRDDTGSAVSWHWKKDCPNGEVE